MKGKRLRKSRHYRNNFYTNVNIINITLVEDIILFAFLQKNLELKTNFYINVKECTRVKIRLHLNMITAYWEQKFLLKIRK